MLEILPDKLLAEAVFNLPIPELLTVCAANKTINKFCKKSDFWTRYFTQNKSEKRSSGISVNEHHLLQLQKLRNRGIGNAHITTKNILVELMKAEEVDFGKGIVGTVGDLAVPTQILIKT
jgi:hypothetical protein